MWCISKRTMLRKKPQVIKHLDIPPSSQCTCPMRGLWVCHNVTACRSGSRILKMQLLLAWAGLLGHPWVTSPQVCKRGFSGLLSVLQVGVVLLIAVRTESGPRIWHGGQALIFGMSMCIKREKNPTTQLTRYMRSYRALFCRLLFHASEIPVLYKFHSILHDLKFLFVRLLVFIMQSNVW